MPSISMFASVGVSDQQVEKADLIISYESQTSLKGVENGIKVRKASVRN